VREREDGENRCEHEGGVVHNGGAVAPRFAIVYKSLAACTLYVKALRRVKKTFLSTNEAPWLVKSVVVRRRLFVVVLVARAHRELRQRRDASSRAIPKCACEPSALPTLPRLLDAQQKIRVETSECCVAYIALILGHEAGHSVPI
jgi:hypothetical protein